MLIHRAPIVALVLSCAFAAPDLAAQVSGSVYTTDRQGDVENVFRNPGEVYLAGGPGPNAGCSGNGLVDGDYYFQVTDPSGSVLLSNDTLAERLVTVSGGVISGSGPGGHGTRNGPCGSKIVKLAPFDPSPSSSGEYKVWFTNILDYVPNTGFHGFIASDSKTDNFKIRGGKLVEQTIIGGTVFFDFDENGLYDPNVPGEVVIPGWKVEITSAGVTTTTFTDADGRYQFIRDRDGSLHDLASLAPDPGYVGETGGRWAPTTAVEVTVVADVPEITVDFGKLFMINTPEFSRSKGYWHNQGELELLACDPVWRTVLNDQCLRTNFSNPNGQAGTLFTVSEGTPFSQAFQELSDYLVGNPALGVLAFNLSVQVAAAHLNRTCGPLQVETYIDRFGDDVLVTFDEMADATRIVLCDPRSADTGPDGDPAWRAVIEACLDEWNGMNSNGSNVFTNSPDPPDFPTPY